jgi:hypothetical protein
LLLAAYAVVKLWGPRPSAPTEPALTQEQLDQAYNLADYAASAPTVALALERLEELEKSLMILNPRSEADRQTIQRSIDAARKDLFHWQRLAPDGQAWVPSYRSHIDVIRMSLPPVRRDIPTDVYTGRVFLICFLFVVVSSWLLRFIAPLIASIIRHRLSR